MVAFNNCKPTPSNLSPSLMPPLHKENTCSENPFSLQALAA